MLVTVDIPDQLARQFRLDEAPCSRGLLEAFLLQRYAGGELSAGQVGEALGLGFYETEQFLSDHSAHPSATPEEQEQDVNDLKRLLTR